MSNPMKEGRRRRRRNLPYYESYNLRDRYPEYGQEEPPVWSGGWLAGREDWEIPGPYAGVGPRNYQRPPERILEDVSEVLANHGLIDASDIEVEVNGTIVTLKGRVNSRRTKRMAEDVVERVMGVTDVNNLLNFR